MDRPETTERRRADVLRLAGRDPDLTVLMLMTRTGATKNSVVRWMRESRLRTNHQERLARANRAADRAQAVLP